MFDPYLLPLASRILPYFVRPLARYGITAAQLTLAGLILALLTVPLLWGGYYLWALLCMALNRLADGLDGELARLQGPTDAGAYLDTAADFIFYGAVVFGFALADPAANSLAAAFLLWSFLCNGASFLGFAIFAKAHNLRSDSYPSKGFYYLTGLTEGSETILFFTLFALFPQYFQKLAFLFALLCLLTAAMRIHFSYRLLSHDQL